MKAVAICMLVLVMTVLLAGPAGALHPAPGGHDGVCTFFALCRTPSGTLKARQDCRPGETPLDPSVLGLCACPPADDAAPLCRVGRKCPGEGKCVDGTCACTAVASCRAGFRWEPSPRVCACVQVPCR